MKKKRTKLHRSWRKNRYTSFSKTALKAFVDHETTLTFGKFLNDSFPAFRGVIKRAVRSKYIPLVTDSAADFLTGTLLKAFGITDIVFKKKSDK